MKWTSPATADVPKQMEEEALEASVLHEALQAAEEHAERDKESSPGKGSGVGDPPHMVSPKALTF